MIRHLLVWLTLTGLAGTSTAAPEIQSETRYYTVQGKTPQAIRQSIETRGPRGDGGRRFHASTRWSVEWGYRWTESNHRCKLRQPQVNLKVNMLLPKLDGKVSLSAARQVEWDIYTKALLRHEQQHREYAVAAANELERELQAIDGWHDCQRLEQMINQRADDVLEKYAALEQEFDRRTDHGAKDGVVLPW